MLARTAGQQTALAKLNVERRLFAWVAALDGNGDPDPLGLWNGAGTVEHGGRTYHPGLFEIEDLVAQSSLTIPGIRVTLSLVEDAPIDLVRGHIVAQRPVEIDCGIFDVDTKALIDNLIPRFDGFVDDLDLRTPPAGGISTITATCESTSRQLTIRRTETRSDASAHERDSNDDIYTYTHVQRKPIFFGKDAP